MANSHSTPRVRELLDEMEDVLKCKKKEISESNSMIWGVLEDLLMKIEEARNELVKGETSRESLMSFVRMAADLIAIIGKIQDTLSYKICCFIAAVYIERYANDYWKKHKVV